MKLSASNIGGAILSPIAVLVVLISLLLECPHYRNTLGVLILMSLIFASVR